MKTKRVHSQGPQSPKKKWMLPLFLGGIMILSTFAIIFSGSNTSSTPSYKYKDIYFRSTPQGWESTVQGYPLLLRSGPTELELLFTEFSFPQASSLLAPQKIYLSAQLEQPIQEALREFYANGDSFPPLTLACVQEGPGCEDLPLKTCADATQQAGVVIFSLGDQESFTVDGTCVTLVANTTATLLQMTDKLIYTLYGVF